MAMHSSCAFSSHPVVYYAPLIVGTSCQVARTIAMGTMGSWKCAGMPRLLRLLLLVLAREVAADEGHCANASGTNVLVSNCDGDDCTVDIVASNGALPDLPEGTEIVMRQVARTCDFDGAITLGGTLSLGQSDTHAAASTNLRQSLFILVDHVNKRGGLRVGNLRYAMHLRIYGDESNVALVASSTAHASRADGGADFLIGPYGSSLTKYAVKQAHADNKIIIAPTATTPAVIADSPLAFGVLPPRKADDFTRGILQAAEACDAYNSTTPNDQNPCAPHNRAARCTANSCVESLLAGFVYEDSTSPRQMCQSGTSVIETAKDSSGNNLLTAVGSFAGTANLAKKNLTADAGYQAYIAELMEALRPHMAAKVTVLIACTYFASARALVDALEQLDYSPLAVMITSAMSDSRYVNLVQAAWWQGEYVIEPVAWHHASDERVRGDFSNMTSQEFEKEYHRRYPGQHLSYLGAAAFAAGAILGSAIEAAGSIENAAVIAKLQSMKLKEFYSDFEFDANGQAISPMRLTQYQPGAVTETVVFEGDTFGGVFPMPTWALRRCLRTTGPQILKGVSLEAQGFPDDFNHLGGYLICSGRGRCDMSGACVCDAGMEGEFCEDTMKPPPSPPEPQGPCSGQGGGALDGAGGGQGGDRARRMQEEGCNMPLEEEGGPEVLIVVAVLVSLLFCLCGYFVYARRLRSRRLKDALTFKDAGTGLAPSLELPPDHKYLLFLSHVWSTGKRVSEECE